MVDDNPEKMMKAMILSYEGKCLIRKFEKCYLTAHQREPSLWEIGYGWTDVLNGVPIHEGSTISQEEAEKLFTKKINLIENYVNKKVNFKLAQCQFDALVSFTLDIGVDNFKGSMLLTRLNSGDINAAADQFLFWHKDKGRTSSDLILRRAYERDFFLGYENNISS